MQSTNFSELTIRALLMTLTLGLLAPAVFAGDEGKTCQAKLDICVDEMVAHLEQRGWVGIEIDPEHEGGILVTSVVAGSPGERAGLREGDVLTSMNGVAYTRDNYTELKKMYGEMVPDGTVTYSVARDDAELDVTVTLAKMPEEMIAKWVGYHVMHAHGGEKTADAGGDG